MISKKQNPKYRVRAECWNKASSEEKSLQKKQAAFYDTLTKDYATQFANQSNVLKSLQTAFTPILDAGINQYGFSTAEDTALRTSASDSIARNFSSAQTALNENLAARGGGNAVYGSGAEGQLEAGLLGTEATTQATTSNQITEAGYATGRSNFLAASGELNSVASGFNPLGYAGAGNTSGADAFNSANIINQQNTAWQGALAGALGGAAGAFLGGPGMAAVMSKGASSGFHDSGTGQPG